ncbi:MAG TPA: zf-HC2 domain-containing protein [Gemmataceae bacterium]|nr:zf-HC2 domain-containing protein [Gemmataceae bacterium]
MPPCPDDATLRAFLRGAVSGVEQESLASHVDGCPSCVERLTGLDGPDDPLLGALRGVSATAPTMTRRSRT